MKRGRAHVGPGTWGSAHAPAGLLGRGILGSSRIAIIVSLLVLLAVSAVADPWPDEVVSVSYGPGAGFGQEFAPDNVLGPPDPLATPSAPANAPEQLLTLGTGGEIVLRFNDGGLIDGPGLDVTVFENPFYVGGGDVAFTECAFVAVSEDGAVWHEFPWDGETLSGLAGVTPVNGAADPLDPTVSGGDSFDLADVGLAGPVRYLRLTDCATAVNDGGPSFDLDAVAALHGEDGTAVGDRTVSLPQSPALRAWPNPFNSAVTVTFPAGTQDAAVVDITGRIVATLAVDRGRVVWDTTGRPSGIYLLRASSSAGTQTLRLVNVQ